MQKWELGSLGVLALVVALVSTSQTLSAPLVELFDSLFIQIIAVFACVGVAYVSPTVGIALAVAFALIFILRNNSHVQSKINNVPLFTGHSDSPATNVGEGGRIIEIEMSLPHKEEPKDVTKVEEPIEGQYPLDEVRPTETAVLRPFEYSPQEDTGSNEFSLVGQSIDEKGMIPPSIKPWMGSPNPQTLQL
jgi:MFS superfamily sulfate permease-like transporter